MGETAKERFLRQLEALKRKDFKEVSRIGREVKEELFRQRREELIQSSQKKFTGFR